MKIFIIQLVLISFTIQTISKRSLLLNEEKKPDRKKCNFLFKSIFIRQKGPSIDIYGTETNDLFRKLCPGIKKSCCTEEELDNQFVQLRKTINVKQKLSDVAKFQKFFSNMKMNDVKNFVKKNNDKIDSCLIDVQKPSDFISFLEETKEKMVNIYKIYADYLIEICKDLFRTQCAVCDKKNSSFFSFSEGNGSKPYNVIVNKKESLNYFKNAETYDFFMSLYYIQQVLNCFLYDLDSKSSLRKKTIFSEVQEYLLNDDYDAIIANPKAKKYFLNYYIPGGPSDIIFDEIIKLIKSTIYERGQTDEVTYRSFSEWTPFEIDKESSFPAFTVDSTSIKIEKEGYNGNDNKVGDNKYWRYIRKTVKGFTYEEALNYEAPSEGEETFEIDSVKIFGFFLAFLYILI